jgi:hypothetical protein
MSKASTISIFIDEELGVDAFEILSKDFSSVSFGIHDELPIPDEGKKHPSYSIEFSQLAELIIPSLQISSSALSISASIFSLWKLRKSSGAPPTIRVLLDGKELDINGAKAEDISRAIETAAGK